MIAFFSALREIRQWVSVKIIQSLTRVKSNKVLFFSYYGAQYGCNPKYISETLRELAPDLDIVWAFTQPEKYSLASIRKVRFNSFKFLYELCTSKVIITNYRMTFAYWKRKNQYYIQTWHSSLRLKAIEKDALSSLKQTYIRMAQRDSYIIDWLISGCSYSTKIFRASFWYNGRILEIGTPRNDIYFKASEKIASKVKSYLGLKPETKLFLYAPTFRQNGDTSCFELDLPRVSKSLHAKWGGDWVPLLRLHPHLRNQSAMLCKKVGAVDVSMYDDVQELLISSDILITDYSSLMFDFIIAQKPCFLYARDYVQYVTKERTLYFTSETLPFPLAKTEEELIHSIAIFDERDYVEKIRDFNVRVGSFEKGHASEQLAEHIVKICAKSNTTPL